MNILCRVNFKFSPCLLLLVFIFASINDAAAACSAHVGKVVFNEVYIPTSGTALIELKVLDPSVLAATSNFQNWKIDLYNKSGATITSQQTDVSSGFSNSATNTCGQTSLWITFPDTVLTFLATKSPPFNMVLYDSSGGGQIVDIMRLGNNVTSFYGPGTQYTSCPAIESQLPATGGANTQYDAQQGSGSSIKDWYRNPDGTGPWDSSTSNPVNTNCGSNQGGAGTFGLAKAPVSTSVSVNTNFDYTLYAINGATPVTTPDPVVITDTLPAGVSFVSCTASPGTISGTSAGPTGTCSYSAGVVTWTVGTMDANKNYKVTLTVKATSGGVISNAIVSNVGTPAVSATAATVTAYAPLADYRMDEASWNSTAGEVMDNSGNGNNARAYNSASTASSSRALTGDPGTCGYGVFDNGAGISAGYIQTPLPNLTGNFTITAWVRTTNNAVTGQRILIDDQNNTNGYGLSLADGTTGRLRFYSRGIGPISFDSTYTIANNTWYFVAAVADFASKRRSIYIYNQSGALLNVSTEAAAWTGTWGTDAGPVSIGGETNASGEAPASFHFRGNLDEVRVYQQVLSQTVLDAFAIQRHPCPGAAADHLLIEHDGTAISCVAEAIVVKACANAACSSLYTGGVTGNLTAGGNVVAFNIPNGQSQTTVNIHIPSNSALPDPQIVRLGTSSVTPVTTDAAGPYCSNSGGAVNNTTSCDMNTYKAGFLFDVPNLTSGTASGTVNISAVRSSDSSTCVPLFQSVTRTVSFWGTYQNPATGTLPLLLNGGNIETTVTPAYTSTAALVFNASGVATLNSVRYDDVGLMQLSARYSGSAANTPPDGGMLVTGSDTFVVKPAKFVLSAIKCTTANTANCGAGALAMATSGDNPAAANPAGGAFIRAGHPFSVTVTALNSLNSATQNYGKETIPESVRLTPNNVTAGMVPAPAIGGTFSAFNAGVASGTAFTWNEVGIITLTPGIGDNDYLGAGDVTGTTSGNVGRFYPEHFDTAVIQVANVPMACPDGSCPASYNGIVYSMQLFSLMVNAMNASGMTTANYNITTGFAKTTALSVFGALGALTAPAGAGSLGVTSVSAFAAGTLTEAAQSYTFTSSTTVPTNIYIRASDGEATSLRALNPTTTSVEGGVEVVSGRLKVSNAYGSELLPLSLTATAQYYTANGWLTSTNDTITNPTLAATYNLIKNASITGTTAASKVPASGLTSGRLTINLAKPSAGGSGVATISPTVPVYLPVVPGTATFGVYNGNNRLIYQREAY